MTDRLSLARDTNRSISRAVLFSLACSAPLLFVPHDSFPVVKGFFFALLLTIAGYSDVKAREIPDEICALILLTSLIRPEPAQSLIGIFLISVPLLIFGTALPGSVGGGDIKLLAASGAVLGAAGIVAGTMLSLILFLIYLCIRVLLHKKREKTYAMAPWFGIGCFLAYLFAYLLETKG